MRRNASPQNVNLYGPTTSNDESRPANANTDQFIPSNDIRKRIFIIAAVLIFLSILKFPSLLQLSGVIIEGGTKKQPKYKGTTWKTERTVKVDTVAETPFARCDIHHVRSEDGHTTVHDWIFMEEMNAVNVAVLDAGGKFVVFEQEKYAIPGKTLSPVGGFIDRGEAPWEAARREVKEELGLGSVRTLQRMKDLGYDLDNPDGAGGMKDDIFYNSTLKMDRVVDEYGLAKGIVPEDESEDWIFLGRYRTAANRGGGFIYTYLLKNAMPVLPNGGTINFVPSGDDEAQKMLFYTMDQIQQHVLDGNFQEIKWAATMANSLLHMKLQ